MNDMQNQIAEVSTDPRANAVVLQKMAMELETMSRNITSLALLVHQRLLDETPRGVLTIICRETAKMTGVSVAVIRGDTRNRQDVRARQLAIWLATELTVYSLGRVGTYFHRHHTTVIHARVAATKLIAGNAEARSMSEILKAQLEVLLRIDTGPSS